MGVLRRHLRAWSGVWCCGQLAFLLAFVPRDCCPAHKAAASAESNEHSHEAIDGAHCPMRGQSADCPQHAAAENAEHHHASQAVPVKDADCSMRGICDSPLAALASLFANQGVASEAITFAVALQIESIVELPVHALTPTPNPPDSPPPRL